MPELTEDLGFLLSRASGVVVRSTNAALTEIGLRVRAYSTLALACDAKDGISQRDLARTLGLDPSQVVALVDELVDKGLVERRPGALDRRTKLVTATRRGRRVRGRADELGGRGREVSLQVLDADEQSHLRELLTRVLAANGSAAPDA